MTYSLHIRVAHSLVLHINIFPHLSFSPAKRLFLAGRHILKDRLSFGQRLVKKAAIQ